MDGTDYSPSKALFAAASETAIWIIRTLEKKRRYNIPL